MPDHNRMRTSRLRQRQARELRQRMTPAEAVLWERLRDRRLAGLKFRRQHPLSPFIVDFYCAAAHLVVELDGGVHDERIEEDRGRTAALEERGYLLLRFRNEHILERMETALQEIAAACGAPETGRSLLDVEGENG